MTAVSVGWFVSLKLTLFFLANRINTYFSSNTPTGSGDLFGIFAFPKDRPPKLDGLMKQTFSAWVNDPGTGQKVKWHLSVSSPFFFLLFISILVFGLPSPPCHFHGAYF